MKKPKIDICKRGFEEFKKVSREILEECKKININKKYGKKEITYGND